MKVSTLIITIICIIVLQISLLIYFFKSDYIFSIIEDETIFPSELEIDNLKAGKSYIIALYFSSKDEITIEIPEQSEEFVKRIGTGSTSLSHNDTTNYEEIRHITVCSEVACEQELHIRNNVIDSILTFKLNFTE